jgi:hypothetical protein
MGIDAASASRSMAKYIRHAFTLEPFRRVAQAAPWSQPVTPPRCFRLGQDQNTGRYGVARGLICQTWRALAKSLPRLLTQM